MVFTDITNICRTTDEGPKKNHVCKFPWRFNGKELNGCTNDSEPDGRYWCSTKITKTLTHVSGEGNWGYCPKSCTGKNHFKYLEIGIWFVI